MGNIKIDQETIRHLFFRQIKAKSLNAKRSGAENFAHLRSNKKEGAGSCGKTDWHEHLIAVGAPIAPSPLGESGKNA
jgi:hypothetical protein